MIRRKPEANRAADAGAGTHPLGLPGIPDADSRGGFSRRIPPPILSVAGGHLTTRRGRWRAAEGGGGRQGTARGTRPGR